MKRKGSAAVVVFLVVLIVVLAVIGGIVYLHYHNGRAVVLPGNGAIQAASGSADSSGSTSLVMVLATTTITIPATSSLVAISGDRYGLFMAPSDIATNFASSSEYINDGTIPSGPYTGYHRIIAEMQFGLDGTDVLTFATKDYQSFILDNSSSSQSELNSFAGEGVYLDTTKIAAEDFIPFPFPPSIGMGQFTLRNTGSYSTSLATDSVELASPVGGLKLYYLPQNDTSQPEGSYLLSDMNVYARDDSGFVADYILDVPSSIGSQNAGLSAITPGTLLYDSYGPLIPDCEGGSMYALQNVAGTDLIDLGAASSGIEMYTFSDPNYPLNQEVYNDKVAASANDPGLAGTIPTSSISSFADFAAKHPVLVFRDPFGRWIGTGEADYDTSGYGCGGKKPVIYLYPAKPTEVTVKFLAPIDLSLSIPAYAGGWDVLADPNGDLQDLQPQLTDCRAIDPAVLGSGYARTACDENKYPYLYWAGRIGRPFPRVTDGWIVMKKDIGSFLEGELAAAGLDQKEVSDMAGYWVPELTGIGAPYYRLSFLQTDQMNALVPVQVIPKPDTEFRLFLLWSPLQRPPATLPPPEPLAHLTRNGFTLVEWGGARQ